MLRFLKENIFTLQKVIFSEKISLESKQSFFEIYSNILKWLKYFVRNNSKHQIELNEEIDLFFSNLDLDFGQIDLICEIFKNNFTLLQNVKDRHLKKFIHCIKNYGCQPKFLNFFHIIQKFENEFILDNQAKTVDYLYFFPLLESKEALFHIFCCIEREKEGLVFDLSKKVPIADTEEKAIKLNFKQNLYGDLPIDFHIKLLNLLILTQSGSDGYNLNNARIKKIFSLKFLLEILVGKDELFVANSQIVAKQKLRKVFSQFIESQAVRVGDIGDYQTKEFTRLKPTVLEYINEIYLKKVEKNMNRFNPLLDFIKNFISMELERLETSERNFFKNKEFLSYFFEKVLAFFNKYIKFLMSDGVLLETDIEDRKDNEMLYLIGEILERNLDNLNELLNKKQLENLKTFLANYFTITDEMEMKLNLALTKKNKILKQENIVNSNDSMIFENYDENFKSESLPTWKYFTHLVLQSFALEKV